MGASLFISDSKFIWNRYLLEPLRENGVSEQWMIEVVHGYVGTFSPFQVFMHFVLGRAFNELQKQDKNCFCFCNCNSDDLSAPMKPCSVAGLASPHFLSGCPLQQNL